MRHCPGAWWVVVGAILLGHAQLSPAQGPCEPWAGRLVSIQGQVEYKRSPSPDWLPSAPDSVYCPGDSLRVGSNSRAAVLLPSETIVRLDQRSTMTFSAPEDEGTSLVDLIEGIGYFLSRVPRRLKVTTPFVNAAVEGTEFLAQAALRESRVLVFEGVVSAENALGRLVLASGEGAVAGPGQAPRKVLIAKPRDAVEWALYYPPVVHYPAAEARPQVRDALDRGDSTAALAALDRVPVRQRDAGFHALRASILLNVGQVEPAQQDLARALELDPAEADAIALQSIVALVLDQPEKAMSRAEEGARLAPTAAAPQVALSYVHQSRFDLDQAWESARAATEFDPDNALAWARRAELELARGNLDAAMAAAEKSTEINPNLTRTRTTLGFAQLLRFDAADAAVSFESAIKLDQADPLPRLGLGISRIRQGQRAQGRRDIEIAATLDPGSSVLRSYLGKAYYDEKRDDLAASQYGLAKTLDPKDPTPWFYDAIRNQIGNRPVEALENLQQSIDRNDNRAVYRSSLMLDSDLAARSASQARIYADLGFDRLALVEGWTSVNESPASFSAHRFLADAYTGQPRLEAARSSELLQSQLWQPLNRNPIQPQLGQSNLGVIDSAGPTLAGPNEYHPLFTRDGVQFQGNLLAGGDSTLADDVAASAVSGIYSLGAGQYHFETDGFRPNADQTHDLYNLFFQVAPSPQDSLQVEYRRSEADFGDRVLRFDPDDFSEALRYERKSDSLRLGGRYDFSPRSKLIVSLIGENSDFARRDSAEVPLKFESVEVSESESRSAELQHVFEGERFNLISGLGYLKVEPNGKARIFLESSSPLFPPTVIEIDNTDAYERYEAYLYSGLELHEDLTLHVGADVFDCENPFLDRSGVHPKLGISWDMTPATRIRAAGFQAVRCVGSDPAEPALSLPQPESQTIVPTQIAGFNQVFDDSSGTESDVYGVALDHRFSDRLFGGISFASRELRVPYLKSEESQEADWGEDVGHLYLNWALDRNWVVALSYDYEKLDYDKDAVPSGATGLTTHRVPLSLRYFSESGWSAGIIPTYVNQEIDLYDTSTGIGEKDSDSFWVVDAAAVYRLPRRYGFVSLEVKNLFDEVFRYQEPDPNVPTLYPNRVFFAKLSLNF